MYEINLKKKTQKNELQKKNKGFRSLFCHNNVKKINKNY